MGATTVYLVFCWSGDGHTVGIGSTFEAAQKIAEEHAATTFRMLIDWKRDKGAYDQWWGTAGIDVHQYSIEEYTLDEVKSRDWEQEDGETS